MCKLLTNGIAKCVKDSDPSQAKTLLEMNEMSRTICSKVTDPLSYLTLSLHSFINLTKLQISAQAQKDHYIYILKQIEGKDMNENILDYYQPLLTFSALVVNNTLKNYNFQTVEEFLREIEEFSIQVLGNHKCFRNLFQLLQLPLILSPTHTKKIQKLNNYYQELSLIDSEVEQHKQELGNKLNMIFVTIMDFYKSEGQTIWGKYPEDVQLEIFLCICKIFELESQNNIQCSCGCFIKENSYQNFSSCQIITSLLDISLSECSDLKPTYHSKVVNIFSKFAEQITYLAHNDCKNWSIAWTTLGTSVYNLGVHLYKKGNMNAVSYFNFYIHHFLKYNKIVSTDCKLLSSCIQAICSFYSKDYRKRLAFAALGIFLCAEQKEYFMSLWIKTKHEFKDQNELPTITLVQAFKIFSKELSLVVNSTNILKEEDEISLLTFELEQYRRKWKSKVPMITALKELSCRVTNPEQITEIIMDKFGNSNLLFLDDVLELTCEIFKKAEENAATHKNSSPKLYKAVLYFLKYKFCMKNAVRNHVDEMERTLKVIPIKASKDIEKDMNEECDIVSTYDHLKINKYLKITKYLHLALSVIETNLVEVLKIGNKLQIYSLLMDMYSEYRLIGNKTDCIRTQNIALKIAQSENAISNIIRSVSFLIEFCNVKNDYIQHLISTTDQLIESINDGEPLDKIYMTYNICKAKTFLYEDPKESYRHYKIALERFNTVEDHSEFGDIKNQLLLLEMKYLSLPCHMMPDIHNGNMFNVFSKIPTYFESCMKSGKLIII